jgi:ketosteroid isomerase-like protein
MPQIQTFAKIVQQWQNAANKNPPDITSIMKLYASDAILCATEGILHGTTEIQGDLQGALQVWTDINLNPTSSSFNHPEEDYQQSGANWAWSAGGWTSNNGTGTGYWSALWVQQGTAWLIQQQSIVTVTQQQ